MEKFLQDPGGLELRAEKEDIRESLGLEVTGETAVGARIIKGVVWTVQRGLGEACTLVSSPARALISGVILRVK